MYQQRSCFAVLLVGIICGACFVENSQAYSALADARIIAEYQFELAGRNHAKIARQLVHQANWASVGTISTENDVLDYPMVNIISIDDNDLNGISTGQIHFLLTDLDFTGKDWRSSNKVSFLFSDEQTLNCHHAGKDPMEPTCARTIISGKVKEMDQSDDGYKPAIAAFEKRHPAAKSWLKAHAFYMCALEIENIFVLDFYGGPHKVTPNEYYAIKL